MHAVALARAGMPLNLLQRQLDHKDITQAMQYAELHPQYGVVSTYMDKVGRELMGEKSSPTVPADNREENESA